MVDLQTATSNESGLMMVDKITFASFSNSVKTPNRFSTDKHRKGPEKSKSKGGKNRSGGCSKMMEGMALDWEEIRAASRMT